MEVECDRFACIDDDDDGTAVTSVTSVTSTDEIAIIVETSFLCAISASAGSAAVGVV